jgi:hypothetical protein
MAELRLVKPRVESSNLSSSACGGRSPQSEYDEEGESWRYVPPLAALLTLERVRLVEEAVLKTVNC